ncbi:MAG: NAD(P)/FAD-dependent oxidoreductase [Desulfurococcaceae archaeon]
MHKYDVAVVGAGVAGLYASYVLALKGWKVALVESKHRSKIGDRVCGDAIGTHHFKELGIHIPDNVVDHRYKGVKVYSPSEQYSIIVPGEGVSINRYKFGQWLLTKALDSGVELYDQHVVVDVEVVNNEVKSLKVKKVNGEVVEIEAKAYIDASGYKPAIRSKLPRDWPISERPYTTDYNIAYREVVELEEPVSEQDVDYAVIYINVDIAPGGYWWLFPKTSDGVVANVGLGVVNNGLHNPRLNFEKYLRPRFRGKIIHSGGGVVPTRKPLPTLVWRNVAVVGDAAYTVNPIHGGGIGSSMLSSHIVSRYLSSALEQGRVDEETMWSVNVEYMSTYGSKQAGLDILRMYMQKLSNEDYEWIMKNRIVDGSSVYELGTRGEISSTVLHAIASFIRLLGKPTLLNQLRTVRHYMNRAQALYAEGYPDNPRKLHTWIQQVEELYREYTELIEFNRGELVKW